MLISQNQMVEQNIHRRLFGVSYRTGIFPDNLSNNHVLPLPKENRIDITENFVSLSNISKLSGKCIDEQLIPYLKKNQLLHPLSPIPSTASQLMICYPTVEFWVSNANRNNSAGHIKTFLVWWSTLRITIIWTIPKLYFWIKNFITCHRIQVVVESRVAVSKWWWIFSLQRGGYWGLYYITCHIYSPYQWCLVDL